MLPVPRLGKGWVGHAAGGNWHAASAKASGSSEVQARMSEVRCRVYTYHNKVLKEPARPSMNVCQTEPARQRAVPNEGR